MVDHRAAGEAEEEKQKAEEGKYRFLIENSGDILWTIDLDGRWQFMTRNVEKVLHLKLSDILGRTVWDFVAPECMAILKDRLKRRMQGEYIPPYEVTVINGNGQRRPFEVVTTPIFDRSGNIVAIQGISRDITFRKQAEEAVRRSEERFKDLVENTYDWVWEADRNLVITYTNPRVRDYLAYAPEEVVGRSMYDFMLPEYATKIEQRLAGMIRDGRQYDVAEKTMLNKDGEPVPFEMTLSLIHARNGAVVGFRGICRDIRDRKRAEEERRKAYEELERRVRERTGELADAKGTAELYLDLMSHDINNMNMVALGKLELLKQSGVCDEEAATMLDGAMEMLTGSSRLIANLRKIQQARSGELKNQVVDLCDVMEETRRNYSAIPGKDVAIDVRYVEKGSCIVLANNLITDVFGNLVDNAIKHALPGRPVRIVMTLSRASEGGRDYYRVTVEDNGPGIPDELKRRLFARLQRGRTGAAGRGLGLYLVKRLVEDFHGNVWVEDRVPGEPEKGTRFVVRLPAADHD